MKNEDLKIEKIPITRTEVFNKLHSAIISGYFKPGDRLIERDLSQLLGVSRTPIREALRELERMRLIKSEPYKGVLVNNISLKEVNDIFVVRVCIEGLSARLCVQNITDAQIKALENNIKEFKEALNNHDLTRMAELDDLFHSVIFDAAMNFTLKEIVENLRSVIVHFRLITLPAHQNETLSEHKEILNALMSHDENLAEKAVQNHIYSFWDMLKKQIRTDSTI